MDVDLPDMASRVHDLRGDEERLLFPVLAIRQYAANVRSPPDQTSPPPSSRLPRPGRGAKSIQSIRTHFGRHRGRTVASVPQDVDSVLQQQDTSRVWKGSLDKAARISPQWHKRETRISDIKREVMSKLTLSVIVKVIYDQELEYNRNDAIKDVATSHHASTFSEAIDAVLSNLATFLRFPKWILGLRVDLRCPRG